MPPTTSSTTSSTTTSARRNTLLTNGAVATVAAAVLAVVIDAVIAAIAHAAGVSDSFKPLQFASFTGLSVIGVVLAGLVWATLRAKSARPRTILRILVPAVVLLSLVPDVILGVGKQQAHTTWGGVVALMLMHLAVTAVAVPAFALSMPVRDRARPV